jgi:hypothetical protein
MLGRDVPDGDEMAEPGPVGAEPKPVGEESAPVGAEPVVPVGDELEGAELRDGRSIGVATAVTAVTGLEASGSAVATLPHTVQ